MYAHRSLSETISVAPLSYIDIISFFYSNAIRVRSSQRAAPPFNSKWLFEAAGRSERVARLFRENEPMPRPVEIPVQELWTKIKSAAVSLDLYPA